MWQIVGASVRGTNHERTHTPCQDSHDFRLVNDEIALAAVADGLGSVGKSDVGAALAVATVLDVLESQLSDGYPVAGIEWTALLQHGFAATRAALEAHARREDMALRELGTTLLVAICHLDWLAVGHLGDGAIVGVWEAGALTTVSPPDHSEYAGQVCPLTADDALESVRYAAWARCPQSIVMMSDGLQPLALDATDDQPHPPFFLPLVQTVRNMGEVRQTSRELVSFLDSARINARTADDKTLVIINHRAATGARPAATVTEGAERR